MQGKGTIRFFAIALAIACLYSLSFTFVVNSVENSAKEYAKGDSKKERAYLDSVANEPVLNLLVAKYTYRECQNRQINLGLDLKGGMNVTMEISLTDLMKSLAGNNDDPKFTEALANAQKRQETSQKDYITLFSEEYAKLVPGGKLAAIFATKENQGRINFNSSNEEVLKVIRAEADRAIARSFNILRTRIDKFGVTQPNIQLQAGSNRVLIELPGVTEQERVRKLLQGTAKLEFWETFENREVYPLLESANKIIAARLKTVKDTTKAVASADTTTVAAEDKKLSLLNKLKTDTSKKDTSNSKSRELLAQENPLFAVLAPSTYTDEQNQQLLSPGAVVGYATEKDTATINQYLNFPEVKSSLPGNLKFLWAVKPLNKTTTFQLFAIKSTSRDNKPVLEGDAIASAREDFDQRGNPEVMMTMNNDGAKIWKRVTAEAAKDPQNKRCVAVVLDNYVYTAPVVQNEISGGVSSISGNFTVEETKDLANVLQAGKLPAPAKIVEEATVGPSLGQEAINAGLLSSVVGLIVVLIFIVFYYSRAGSVATIALFVNVFFIMGVLASLGAVLTLPGIAGIVLTIGISVDANVLIFERIREELAEGKSLRIAIADGFRHAFSTVIDSNVVTLLTAIVLYTFGSGPIQGFATTLIIGILCSLFCGIFITRLIFEWMLGKDMDIRFSIPFTANTLKNVNFGWVKNRKYYYIFSTILISAGIASMAIRGMNYGVDFEGGRSYIVRFEKSVTTEDVRIALEKALDSKPEVKTFGSDNQIKITTSYLINSTEEGVDKKVEDAILDGLKPLNDGATIMSSQKVGPTVANDIKVGALYSILIALAIIFVYIYIRFRKWQYSLGAIVALAHDVLIVLSLFSLLNGILPFSLDVDQTFIAALLTVVGYSITDTVVVFDRIREYLSLHHSKQDDMKTVINDAINNTLSRTIITSLTVLFVLLVLFLFGGDVIRGFSFALLIGILFGTYSSICIATPVMVDFIRKKK